MLQPRYDIRQDKVEPSQDYDVLKKKKSVQVRVPVVSRLKGRNEH